MRSATFPQGPPAALVRETAAANRQRARVGSARRRTPEPAAAPYDAERAVPPRLPAQPRVACLLRAAVVLLGTVLLTRGALRLLRALAPLLPRLGFALE